MAVVVAASSLSAQVLSAHVAVAGTRRVWVDCRGTGSPTVVLESGHGEDSGTWDEVFARTSALTRVCRYDRAGLGRSDPDPGVRTAGDVTTDLRAALQGAGVHGPLLLVGHSLGGAFVRCYAHAFPRDVVGLVLVDAVHEDEFARIDQLLTPAQRQAGAGMRPMSREGFDIDRMFAELRNVSTGGDRPVRVIARGMPLRDEEMPPDWSPRQRAAREELRRELQRDLVRRAGTGSVTWAERSGHFVHQDEPALVEAAIRELILLQRSTPRR
jgi:pimeloyl-ACP methyl ester carboxylesterase